MRDILTAGLTALGLDTAAAPQLERYAALLLEKNKVMNLTAITDERDVATLHLLDCAALLAQADMRGKTVIDVGTGAGFPGMVLAILEPSARFTLLDSLGKRVDFLREVCEQLGLKNVTCVHARAEEFAAAHSAIAQLGGQLAGCTDYRVPETDVIHRIVRIEKVRPTPKQFPRAFARIKKAPLV